MPMDSTINLDIGRTLSPRPRNMPISRAMKKKSNGGLNRTNNALNMGPSTQHDYGGNYTADDLAYDQLQATNQYNENLAARQGRGIQLLNAGQDRVRTDYQNANTALRHQTELAQNNFDVGRGDIQRATGAGNAALDTGAGYLQGGYDQSQNYLQGARGDISGALDRTQGYYGAGRGDIARAMGGVNTLYGDAAGKWEDYAGNASGLRKDALSEYDTAKDATDSIYGSAFGDINQWGQEANNYYGGAIDATNQGLGRQGELYNYARNAYAAGGDTGDYNRAIGRIEQGGRMSRNAYGGAEDALYGGLNDASGYWNQALEGADAFGRQAEGRIKEDLATRTGGLEADLASRGLRSSTIAPSLEAGYARDAADLQLGVEEGRQRLRLDSLNNLAGANLSTGRDVSGVRQNRAGMEGQIANAVAGQYNARAGAGERMAGNIAGSYGEEAKATQAGVGDISRIMQAQAGEAGKIGEARLGVREAQTGKELAYAGARAGEINKDITTQGEIARAMAGLKTDEAGNVLDAGKTLAGISGDMAGAETGAGKDLAEISGKQGDTAKEEGTALAAIEAQRAKLETEGGQALAGLMERAGGNRMLAAQMLAQNWNARASAEQQLSNQEAEYLVENLPKIWTQGAQPMAPEQKSSILGTIASFFGASAAEKSGNDIGAMLATKLTNFLK